MKNTPTGHVRNRTPAAKSPETRDRRVRRTRRSLHEAVVDLARQRPYETIAVRDILERADVSKSTFYTHFDSKDELLHSGIRSMLQSLRREPVCADSLEHALGFSRPFLDHVDEHRRGGGEMASRIVMHDHLETVLTSLIIEDLKAVGSGRAVSRIPVDLLAGHIASTFVRVLNWWIERDTQWTPAEADARFRALVLPALRVR